jgi:hypothetical protein
MNRIEIIAEGLCYQTLCVEKDVTKEELSSFQRTSGTIRGWQLCEDPTFASGHSNPCICDQDRNRMHYLRDC